MVIKMNLKVRKIIPENQNFLKEAESQCKDKRVHVVHSKSLLQFKLIQIYTIGEILPEKASIL